MEKSTLCPEKIKKNPDLFTGVSYDNFDRFVETTKGKDTLHDTVGIIYQNFELHTTEESDESEALAPNNTPEESNESEVPAPNNVTNSLKKRLRRRRTFEEIVIEEAPYPKKPKMTTELQSTVDNIESVESIHSQKYAELRQYLDDKSCS